MSNLSALQDKINRSRELDFGDVFTRSVDLFKKVWVQGILLQLFSVIVMLPIIIILYVPLIAVVFAETSDGFLDTDAVNSFFAGLSLIYVFFLIAGFIVIAAVIMALKAAFYRIVMKLDHNKEVTISDFFYFLKSNYLSKAFVLVIFSLIIGVPAVLLCVLPIFYVMVPLAFFSVIFAFNPDMSPGDILNVSFNLGNKKWLLVFGLMVVIGFVLWILSYVTCGLANIFLTSFMYLPMYIVYKQVVGFDDMSEIENIGLIEE